MSGLSHQRSVSPYGVRFYEGQRAASADAARSMIPHLLALYPVSAVVDVGCGVGTWLAEFQRHGVREILGIDGDWVLRAEPDIAQHCIVTMDLTAPQKVNRRFDLAVSLEVAEHLPSSAADRFVAYLVSLAPVVLFSAAIPLQGGTDHLNEQWPAYWAERFAAHSYQCFDVLRPILWEQSGIAYYYIQNSFLYVAPDADPVLQSRLSELPTYTPPDSLPPSFVHPRKFLEAAGLTNIGIRPLLRAVPGSVGRFVRRRVAALHQ